MAVLIPHFDMPFRLSGHSFAVVEQDSQEDIANCVECIVRTPFGFRDDAPEFGVDDQQFEFIPLDIETLIAQIEGQEPRSRIVIEQQPNLIDALIDTLRLQVNR